jgi:hypothetical protein
MDIHEYPPRSIEQHRAEWLYYQIIAESTWHTAYEIYENMALRLLKVLDYEGEIFIIKPSSLNTLQHNNYMERIRAEMAEIGIILPDPTKDIDLQQKTRKIK